jgi:dihydropteroate synthase
MNDFIALRMYDMSKDKEIERLHSIIKEVREKLEYLLTHDKVEINGTIYLKQEADDFITNYILEILDKENK